MTKFKVAFTMDAKTLFLIISKMLPIEDLKVEEKLDKAELQAALHSLAWKAERAKLAQPSKKRRSSFNPDKGINKIILNLLSKRPYHAVELRKPLEENGFSPNSVGSRLTELRIRGLWSLDSEQAKLAQSQKEVKHG
jgi:hypothetical protein